MNEDTHNCRKCGGNKFYADKQGEIICIECGRKYVFGEWGGERGRNPRWLRIKEEGPKKDG